MLDVGSVPDKRQTIDDRPVSGQQMAANPSDDACSTRPRYCKLG